MEHCELIPGRGIRCGNIDIFFGMKRKDLKKALGEPKPQPDTMWDDEDEYAAHGEDWLRLRFLDKTLCDIEVIGGSLTHEGIELKNTHMPRLRADLSQAGMKLEKTEWLSEGLDCVDLQIVVASGDDIGEAGDAIEWVITSSDFRVEE